MRDKSDHTLDNTTCDGNQTEETAAGISAATNAWINAAIDEWFHNLQTTSRNLISQLFSSSAPSETIHVPPPKLHTPAHPIQMPPADLAMPPLSSSATYSVPHVPIHVLPPNSDQPPPLLSQICMPYHSLTLVTILMLGTLKFTQQLEGLRQQIAAIEASGNIQHSGSWPSYTCTDSVKIVLKRRHKFGFLTGEILRPLLEDPQERYWKREDSLLQSTLINRMEPQINKPLLIYDFLAGLNPKFDVVRGRVLGQRPIPFLMEVYYEIRLEEECTSAMSILATPIIDSTAFSVRSSTSGSDKHNGKSILVCEHWKKQWHTKEQSWKLHGRPPRGRTPGFWILDSNAIYHQTGSSKHFVSYIPCASNETIRIAYGSLTPIAGKGKISPYVELSLYVLHMSKISYNLLSISKITYELNYKAIFLPDFVSFQDLSLEKTIDTAWHSRRLFLLDDDTSSSSISRTSLLSSYFTTSEQDCILWHFRLGPSKITISSRKRWFVTFIDDHTRLTWVFLVSEKSEVTFVLKDFYNTVEMQFNAKIAILQSDNGHEFQNHSLSEILSSKGIVHQSYYAYSPQQNGVTECKNRHLLEVACSFMLSTSLPSYLWGDVVLIAAYLINQIPSRVLHLQTRVISLYLPHF
ncbi:Retrovirus-related Pol polyprotein from transposon TNT 1-94 [Cucumis melo var. makuwa]|uniref:Retrovirus-related Pol polyprotein from transposon TNT 1-94 n=1 Tax=Cucumis melo var. makuwa TaxID=1194695 RepID=A0A5D3DRM9_CUCMM|nr:Retrovirus-related Pol polyprotein from transposon TNT 1-94 [Cucumis melo var. makuwa]